MKLDRTAQRDLLQRAEATYPGPLILTATEQSDPAVLVNACYLRGHGLLDCSIAESFGKPIAVVTATITERGLDFLADDGGLTAILGTVTIRLHDDTLRALLRQRVAQSDLPMAEKETIADHLKSVPGEVLSNLATRFLEEGLTRLPDAIPLLTKLLGL